MNLKEYLNLSKACKRLEKSEYLHGTGPLRGGKRIIGEFSNIFAVINGNKK